MLSLHLRWITRVSLLITVSQAFIVSSRGDSPSLHDLTASARDQRATSISTPANLALKKVVTTSSSVGAHTANKAVDGVFHEYWQHAARDTQPSLVVDLGRVYENIDRINLSYFVGRVATHSTLEYSTDNAHWTVVVDNPNGVQTTRQDNLFDPVSARYIRYTVHKIATGAVFVGLDEIQVYQRRPVQECVPRDEAPNFFSKLKNGEDVTIAYLGGSITAGVALPSPGGYRVQSLAWFRKAYPGVTIHEINSSIGGTGTEVALRRLDRLANDFDPKQVAKAVLNREDGLSPDLVFIEFAVNDSHQPYETILGNMEQLVRRTWENDPRIDIVFVYTMKTVDGRHGKVDYADTGVHYNTATDNNDIYTLNHHRYQVSAAAFEEVADHYGIPTIHMGKEIAEQAARGEIIHQRALGIDCQGREILTPNPRNLPVFSPDGVHPYASGHVLYTQALQRAFLAIRNNPAAFPHPVPRPIRSDESSQ